MKKNWIDNIKTLVCLMLLMPLAMMIKGIPWYSFLIVVTLFGFIITIRKWKVAAFSIGFLSGLIVWVGANLFYHLIFGGAVFEKLAKVMFIPAFVVFLLSGIIGGLLTGLALYTGQSAVKRVEI